MRGEAVWVGDAAPDIRFQLAETFPHVAPQISIRRTIATIALGW